VIGNREVCCTNSDCRLNWIGVNPVGDVYPCDRYVPEKYYMGNIMEVNSIDELYQSEGYRRYCMEIQERIRTYCLDCGYYNYCQGGCNANHIAVSGSANGIDAFSCDLFRYKFNKVYDILRNVDIYDNKLNTSFLKLAPLSLGQFFISLGIAAASIMWYEIVKLVKKIRSTRNKTNPIG
jgi:radical SAM protein with 4Fe4S-binding SPASM domain